MVKGLIVLEVVVMVSGVLMVLVGQGHYIHLEYRPQISSFRSAQLGSTEFPVLTARIFIPVSGPSTIPTTAEQDPQADHPPLGRHHSTTREQIITDH